MTTPLRALALIALALPAPAIADTLIDNANGIQVDSEGRIERFTGLVIGEDGKVVRLIRAGDEKQPAKITSRIDVGGRTLLPGLIDAHGHVVDSPGQGMGLGLTSLRLDLNAVRSIAELQQRLKAYAEANPDVPWILGRGWNQELFAEARFPTARDLDAVVPGRPVWIERVDGHAAVANTTALKLADVTARTTDPAGGKIERDASGAPTGLFIDNASALVADRIPKPSDALMDRALAKAQEVLLSHGITAVADMGTSSQGWAAMRRLGNNGRLTIRIMAYADGFAPFGSVGGPAPTPWLFSDRLRLGGVKLYADGALGSRGAWLKRPYADQPNTSGLSLMTGPELRAQAEQGAAAGFQIAIHAIGDRANAQAIETFEALNRSGITDRRWRIEHVQVIDPADIPRLAKANIIASMQPTHQTSDRLMAEARLGPERLGGAYAWNSILGSGARLAFGSDFPVESPNPFPGLAAAISRQDMNGQPPGGWLPQERISLAAALAAFTRGAAYASFAEDRIGSLDPGKWADFILIDRDPTAVDSQSLARTKVLETWVAGRKVSPPSAGPSGERGQ